MGKQEEHGRDPVRTNAVRGVADPRSLGRAASGPFHRFLPPFCPSSRIPPTPRSRVSSNSAIRATVPVRRVRRPPLLPFPHPVPLPPPAPSDTSSEAGAMGGPSKGQSSSPSPPVALRRVDLNILLARLKAMQPRPSLPRSPIPVPTPRSRLPHVPSYPSPPIPTPFTLSCPPHVPKNFLFPVSFTSGLAFPSTIHIPNMSDGLSLLLFPILRLHPFHLRPHSPFPRFPFLPLNPVCPCEYAKSVVGPATVLWASIDNT